MIRFLIASLIITLIPKHSFATNHKDIEDQYQVIKIARSENYYELPNANSHYQSGATNSLDGYYNSQYKGRREFKNIVPYSKPKVYLELGLRGVNINDTKLDDTSTTNSFDSNNISFNTGYGGSMKFGIESTDHRCDFEFAHETNSAQEFTFKSSTISNLKFQDAQMNAITFDLNYYKDFYKDQKISPYIGVGAGVSIISLDIGKASNDQSFDVGKGFDKVGNYQLILGSRFNLGNKNKLNFNYRYKSIIKDFELPTQTDDGSGNLVASDPIEVGYGAHIVEIAYQILF